MIVEVALCPVIVMFLLMVKPLVTLVVSDAFDQSNVPVRLMVSPELAAL